MKKSRILIVIILMLVFLLFAYGSTLMQNCTQINGCSSCWRMTSIEVTSELCPGSDETNIETCTAEPYQQQHNAIVDALLCACNKAEAGGYADSELNKQIEDVFKNHMGYVMAATDLCDNPGLTLVKMRYS